ncbi:MAG TPA: response regulator transcription factor [Phenylobacterium sp.]|jgi:DNA-binding response OmpR family regulator|nr:response regulator transcription factor [Phenylobacterium sp.]
MRTLYVADGPPDARLMQGLRELDHVVDAADGLEDGLALAGFGDWRAIVCDLADAAPAVAALHAAAPDAWLVALCPQPSAEQRIALLGAGADLVLSQPYEFRELSAHLAGMARRSLRPGAAQPARADFDLRPAERSVILQGETVALSAQEFALLALLASHPDQVMGIERILAAVWGDAEPRPELVRNYVSRLRAKLERGRPWRLIHAARGHGYRFHLEPAPPPGDLRK